MNESVLSDALVMPSSSGWPVAAFLSSADSRLFSFLKAVHHLVDQERTVADLLDLHQRIICREITSMCC
jgi:hypothetical protein